MLTDILKQIAIWFTSLGYWGVFLACVGLFPAEIVIAMVAATRPQDILQIAAVGALGEVVGAYFTYIVGYYFRKKDLVKFLTEGKGKILNISEESYHRSYNSLKRNGAIYILATRLLPWIRVATLVVAGYLEFNIPILSLAVFIGTIIYTYFFGYIGAEIGFNWERIKAVIDTFNNASMALVIIAILIYVYINREKFFRRNGKETRNKNHS